MVIHAIEIMVQYLTLNVGLQPTGFAREAWNVLKFMSAYAARKKLEIKGAIAFNSPATHKHKRWNYHSELKKMSTLQSR
jgi:hypothetical protein